MFLLAAANTPRSVTRIQNALYVAFIAVCSSVVIVFAQMARLIKPCSKSNEYKQESQAIADKPARRESLPKIAPIRRAYNVVADNTGLSSFV